MKITTFLGLILLSRRVTCSQSLPRGFIRTQSFTHIQTSFTRNTSVKRIKQLEARKNLINLILISYLLFLIGMLFKHLARDHALVLGWGLLCWRSKLLSCLSTESFPSFLVPRQLSHWNWIQPASWAILREGYGPGLLGGACNRRGIKIWPWNLGWLTTSYLLISPTISLLYF